MPKPEPTPQPITPVEVIQQHLADLHHTQTVLTEQSVGVANQIFILEHILKDMGVPIAQTKTKVAEGSEAEVAGAPETEEVSGAGGSLIL